jgi:2-oxoglutarate ferredoxin oxidoreductase subunit alpha
MTDRDSLTIRFEGDSGDGILTMGLVAARAAARLGFHVYTYSTYLAVVRGGQSTFQLRLGRNPLLSQGDAPDVLVALNPQAVRGNGREVVDDGLILHPMVDGELGDIVNPRARLAPIDFEEAAVEETGQARCKNIVALGALLETVGLGCETGQEATRQIFASKGHEIVELNLRALKTGQEIARERPGALPDFKLPRPASPIARMLLSGNEAVALGALIAGVRFFAGYPITPASEIMEWLAKHLPRVGGRMVQAEDEIAALAMCIGASYGGVKSMTATSGPGLSLMSELIGLAGMMETPIVIVDVQRAGPSTGMPTKEGQGDLNIATHGVHGEVPRIVMAPKTVEGCFQQTIEAVNVSHEYHIPVVLLSSQSLSHRMQTVTPPDPESISIYSEPLFEGCDDGVPFARFRPTPDGRPSVRSVPGIPGGMYRASGLEHDELGNPNFEPRAREAMVERRRERMKAVQIAFADADADDYHCDPEAVIGIMSWGATASIARETIDQMRREGWKISYYFPSVIWPMADKTIERFLASGIRRLFVCELNATRQYGKMVRARYTTDLIAHDIRVMGITKDTGLPFTAAEIRRRVFEHVGDDPAGSLLPPFDAQTVRDRVFPMSEDKHSAGAAIADKDDAQ